MILDVRSATLEAKGIHAGMEIMQVDGENAISYAQRVVEPFVNASTPQDREVRTYWYGFLRGSSAQSVRLTLRLGRETDGRRSDPQRFYGRPCRASVGVAHA
jgi:carboxyl-terminal processing protease